MMGSCGRGARQNELSGLLINMKRLFYESQISMGQYDEPMIEPMMMEYL